jgi:hypothetical protein
MELVTDGANLASIVVNSLNVISGVTFTNAMGVHWYVLRETQLPANGANNLNVQFAITSNNFVVGWWILENCSQSPHVRSVANASTLAAVTTLAVTLGYGALSDACLVAGCNNTTAGTIQITIGGIAVTEDFDVTLATNQAHGAAGTDLTAPSLAPVVCDMTYTLAATPRTAMSAIRIQ